MSKILLKKVNTVVTCDDNDRVLHDVDVWFEDGKILSIGSLDAVADEEYDCSKMLLYPGLINTHHHLYQYFTRNLSEVQGLELFDWLTALYQIWKNLNADTVLYSSLCGMGELMRYGCTTCMDHHYVFPKNSGDLICAQFEAADALGIRMHVSRGSMDLSKKDGGLPPDSVVQTVDEIIKDSQRIIEKYNDAQPYSMHRVLLAPCSPFSVSDTLLKESAILARQYGVRLHTHLCETQDEQRYTLEKVGLRPLAYMETLGWLGSDVHYAHGIHFNDEELVLLRDTQTGVCHCPSSNMKLASGVARIPDMLKMGIPVGLGVDGSASNDASNMISEIRTAYLLLRLTYADRAPSGYELLKMATRGSARLIGRDELGQIKEGFAADVFLIKKDSMDMVCADRDVKNIFGTIGYNRPCALVFVNGKCTVRGGILQNVDEDLLARRSQSEVERLLK
ncbi:MAG: 8-oxoguanine deaminase [Eubacteriales bacterium]|nr:8-oxoguanine deaminase [Eubacteriales bacterium]